MSEHKPAAHASYSSVDSWLQCGQKYYLTKIEGHKEDPAWWSVGGSAVHHATEWWDLGMHQELNTTDLFLRAFEEQTANEAEWTGTSPKDWRNSRGQDGDWWRANGAPMVQAWIDWRQETGWHIFEFEVDDGVNDVPHFFPGVEVPFEVDIGGVPVKGYIDRVMVTDAGEVVVVDLKSGARKPDSPLQLGYYRAALEEQYGVHADLGGYFMNRKKKGEQIEVTGLGKYTPEFIGRFVQGFQRARELNLYVPHVTAFCKSCGVAAHCWAATGVSQ